MGDFAGLCAVVETDIINLRDFHVFTSIPKLTVFPAMNNVGVFLSQAKPSLEPVVGMHWHIGVIAPS